MFHGLLRSLLGHLNLAWRRPGLKEQAKAEASSRTRKGCSLRSVLGIAICMFLPRLLLLRLLHLLRLPHRLCLLNLLCLESDGEGGERERRSGGFEKNLQTLGRLGAAWKSLARLGRSDAAER